MLFSIPPIPDDEFYRVNNLWHKNIFFPESIYDNIIEIFLFFHYEKYKTLL